VRDGLGWYLTGGSTAMDGTCQDVPREDIVWMAWKDGQGGHSGLVGLLAYVDQHSQLLDLGPKCRF